jgi:hypothetical protein
MIFKSLTLKCLLTLISLSPFLNLFAQPELEQEIIKTIINSQLQADLDIRPRDTIFNKKGQIKRIKGFTFSFIYMKPFTETKFYQPTDTLFNYCKKFMTNLERETFDNFITNNLSPIRIDTITKLKFGVKPLPEDFIGDGHNPIVSVSRPGFNLMKNEALVYYSRRWGPLSGLGAYYLLVKGPNGWIIKRWALAWIS